MNNKKMASSIDKLINDSLDYYKLIIEEYGLLGKTQLTIYNTAFDTEYPPDLEYVRKDSNARMITLFVPQISHTRSKQKLDQIVEGFKIGIFMSYENLFSLIIDCELNFDSVLESMKFTIRHEVGHIIDKFQTSIGLTTDQWNINCEIADNEMQSIPELRKNASYKNRLKWFRMYNNIPVEKRANDAVGITDDDIVADWKRTHSCD